MPRIELIPENLHESFHPYHHEFDNLPLRSILQRQSMINTTLDQLVTSYNDAIGDAGSLGARLDKSLEDDGSLKVSAVNATSHSIDSHTDSSNYVRMTVAERSKLSLIDDEANDLQLSFDTAGPSETAVQFENGTVTFSDSTTVLWRLSSGKIYADLNFSTNNLHTHTYNQAAIHVSSYTTFKTPVPFEEGSLRVYVNGGRVFEDSAVYHPGATPEDEWVLNQFTSNYSTGQFVFDTALQADDIVITDFDRAI